MFNINDTVSYESADGTLRNGTILEVSSDMDSYEDMKLKDGTPMYWSKKTKKYVPVKEKNIARFRQAAEIAFASQESIREVAA